MMKTTKNTEAVESLKFVPLGGLEEIGRNMMFFEYKDEIVIIDAGLQFPEESTPGVDFIIPNVNYLEKNKHKIKGLIITHAHYDHMGAISYIITKIGNPTIYTAAIGKEIINKRHEEFTNLPKLRMEIVQDGSKAKMGKYFDVEFFNLDHTIPDTIGVILKTPVGNMVHFVDFKFDYDLDGKPKGLDSYARIGNEGVHTLFIDSTNADQDGVSLSERIVEKNLEKLMEAAEGRVIVSTFASLLTRLGEIIKIAARQKKKVFVSGYTMKTNLQIAQNLGYVKPEKGQILPLEELNKYKDNKVVILCTGAQGQANAALMRIANGEDRWIQARPGDTFILSSSIIPGNERPVQTLKDNLCRQGAKIYQSKDIDIHATGHAPREELKEVYRLIKPKFLVPVHGYYFKRAANKENGVAAGIPEKNAFLMDNGQVAEITKESFRVTDKTVDAFYVMVDGLGVGDVSDVVLRDRRILSDEGMMVIIATLDKEKGHFLKKPDIISRGFIYLKDNQTMLEEIRHKLRHIVERIPRHQPLDPDYVKSLVRDQIGTFLYNKTKRRPMILPVIIEV